ncbi:MAG: hypothetical protein AAGF78_02535 [Pseudomonadota bacterium]
MGANLGPVARWSIVIVVGVILYMGATYVADLSGWQPGMSRTLMIGMGIGLPLGGLAAALGLVGKDD